MAVGYPPPRGGETSVWRWVRGHCWALAGLWLFQPQAAAQDHTSAAALAGMLRFIVLQGSPLVEARRAAVTAAQARAGATGFRPPAVLAAEAEEIPDALRVDRAGSLRLEVQQEFLGEARGVASRALARTDVERAEARLAAAEMQVVARADLGLVRWAGWTQIAARVAAEDSLLAEAEEALRTRFAVGTARYVDLLRLRSERLRVASERATALAEAAIGRRLLVGLVGVPQRPRLERALDSAVTSLPEALARLISTPLPDTIRADALLAGSVAIRLAAVDVSRAQAAQRLFRAEQRPRLAAALGVQRFVGENGRMSAGPVLGASVSLPFTARHATSAAAAAAARAVDAAQAEQTAVEAEVRAGLEAAVVRFETARARLSVFSGALLLGARQEREGALANYRSGELPLIELLDFERALARAEIERIRARIDAADALADLAARASGEALTGTGEPAFERGGR